VFSNQLKLFTFDLNNGSFYHIQHPPPPSSTTPPLPPSTAAYIQQMKGDDEWVNDRIQFWRDRMSHVMAQCDDL